jgi:putative addiction module killer protein
MRVQEYILEDGSSPYKKWFDSLDAVAAAKVTTAKVRMELGVISSIKWIGGIGEYKIDWGPGYRIYLAQDGADLIILFGGGTKRSQGADIKEAKRLHEEYKTRKAEHARLKAEQEKAKATKHKKNQKGKKGKT